MAMDKVPAHGGMRPVMTGASKLWAGMRINDMAPTIKAMLHCSQQMHLKLLSGGRCQASSSIEL
ncbi:MAG: hypothetical protein WAM90_07020 [Rhodanobacter sp.]